MVVFISDISKKLDFTTLAAMLKKKSNIFMKIFLNYFVSIKTKK